MPTVAAQWIVAALGTYLALGVCFALPFLVRGVTAIDPAARESGRGFRWIILPGVIALWPVLARAWMRRGPPHESTAHRRAVRRSGDR